MNNEASFRAIELRSEEPPSSDGDEVPFDPASEWDLDDEGPGDFMDSTR